MRIKLILALAAITTGANAEGSNQPNIEAIVPEGMEFLVEQYTYSPAVRAGDYVYLAGVVATLPISEEGDLAPSTPENLTAAYESAFKEIETILSEAGASWADVVDMTTYHTDELHKQIDAFIPVKNRYQSEPYPAWTAIDIDRLYPDGGITEIKVTAYAPLDRQD